MWRCHQLLSGFLAKGHLPRVSRQSRLSANDKNDNEKTLGTVHRFRGICLTAGENPGNPQLGDSLMKAVLTVITSNGAPYFQMRSLGSHSTSGREEEKTILCWRYTLLNSLSMLEAEFHDFQSFSSFRWLVLLFVKILFDILVAKPTWHVNRGMIFCTFPVSGL